MGEHEPNNIRQCATCALSDPWNECMCVCVCMHVYVCVRTRVHPQTHDVHMYVYMCARACGFRQEC
jgi:hypothetical protein